MTEPKRVKLRKFTKAVLAGKTQRQAAVLAGAKDGPGADARGSEMMKEPEVVNALEAAFRKVEANEEYLAGKIKAGADAKSSFLQLEYLDRIKDGLGYGKKDIQVSDTNFNILSIIQQHGLVGKNGQPIEAKGIIDS